MTVRFAEVLGFGSGFALGAAQTGMKMVAKCERFDSFGASNAWANRELLGNDWELQIDRDRKGIGWDRIDAEVVVTNPPCAAFSTLNMVKESKGTGGAVNWHMWAMIEYMTQVRPQIVAMESVQGAYTAGVELMRQLASYLNDKTGLKYTITHVLHNNLSLGGMALRRRYFLVLSQVPFGVEVPELPYVPTADDCMHDLEDQALTWEPQPYRRPATRWSGQLRSASGVVDGHQIVETPNWRRAVWVAENLASDGWHPQDQGWPQGAGLEDLCREHYRRFGDLPGDAEQPRNDWRIGWQYKVPEKLQNPDAPAADQMAALQDGAMISRAEHLRRRDFTMGPTQLSRWRANRHGYVITGGALFEYVHPHVRRTFTHREAARIMGFPDDWKIGPQRWDSSLPAYWGKGVPVHSGRWVAQWAKNAVEGSPGSVTGKPVESSDSLPGERVIDVTYSWRKFLGEDWRSYMNRTRPGDRPNLTESPAPA